MGYKCPHCGSNIRAGAGTCKECGNNVYWIPSSKDTSDIKVVSIKSQVQLKSKVNDVNQVYEKLFTQMFSAIQRFWKVKHLFYNNAEAYEAVLDISIGQPTLSTELKKEAPKPKTSKPISKPVVKSQPKVESVRVDDDLQLSMPISQQTQAPQKMNEYDRYIEALKKNPQYKASSTQPNDEFLSFQQRLKQSQMETPNINNNGDGFTMNIF